MLESTDPDLANALKDIRDQEYHSVLNKETRISGIPPLDLGFVHSQSSMDAEDHNSQLQNYEETSIISNTSGQNSDTLRNMNLELIEKESDYQTESSFDDSIDLQSAYNSVEPNHMIPKLDLSTTNLVKEETKQVYEYKMGNSKPYADDSERSTAKMPQFHIPTEKIEKAPLGFHEEFMENFEDFSESWRA